MLHRRCRERRAAQGARIAELHRALGAKHDAHTAQLDRAREAEAALEEAEMAHGHLVEEIANAVADPAYAQEAVIPEVLRQALLEWEELRDEAARL